MQDMRAHRPTVQSLPRPTATPTNVPTNAGRVTGTKTATAAPLDRSGGRPPVRMAGLPTTGQAKRPTTQTAAMTHWGTRGPISANTGPRTAVSLGFMPTSLRGSSVTPNRGVATL